MYHWLNIFKLWKPLTFEFVNCLSFSPVDLFVFYSAARRPLGWFCHTAGVLKVSQVQTERLLETSDFTMFKLQMQKDVEDNVNMNGSSYPTRSHSSCHWAQMCTAAADSHTSGRSCCPQAFFPAAPGRSGGRRRSNLSLSAVWRGCGIFFCTGDSLLHGSQ